MRPLALAALALVLLAGCGTPSGPAPGEVTAPGGASGGAGSIEIRDARFADDPPREGDRAYAPGDDAPLVATIVNTGDGVDRLLEVSSPVAEEVTVAGETALPGGATLAVGYPAGTDVRPAEGEAASVAGRIVATDLRRPLRVGVTYPVTFTFARAGEVTLNLPVAGPDAPAPRAGGS